MYKIHINAPSELYRFIQELNHILLRKKGGNKGFKRELHHHLTIEKNCEIIINFKDYAAQPDPDTGLYNPEQLPTADENNAFVALINEFHLQSMLYNTVYEFTTFFDFENKPVDKTVLLAITKNLCVFGVKPHGPNNFMAPILKFTMTEADWETDRSLWNKLDLMARYLGMVNQLLDCIPINWAAVKKSEENLRSSWCTDIESDEEIPGKYAECIAAAIAVCK